MKFLKYALPVIAVKARFEDISAAIEVTVPDAIDIANTEDDSKFTVDSETEKKLRSFGSSWAQEIIQNINGYGCWCYFQDNHGKGNGPAQNEVDNQCKILHEGYSCILMDAEEEGDDDCVPWDVSYNSATGLGLLVNDVYTNKKNQNNNDSLENALRYRCRKANKKNKCGERACIVENYFVVRMVRLFLHGIAFDPSLKHSIGIFDPKLDCPHVGGQASDKQCCGNYPLRLPFKTLGGTRDCCGVKTFNTDLMMCCDDGVVRLSC